MPKKRRKRRRGKRYHTGIHNSPKLLNGPAHYRSGWEVRYMQYLDTNPDVLSYEYEGLKIKYISNIKTGRLRTYIPDLFVTYIDGTHQLVEVKPIRRLTTPAVIKKNRAGQDWCNSNAATFILVTEETLKQLKI